MVGPPTPHDPEPARVTPEVAGDALCELMTIGTGNAATAVSKLLGRHRIMLSVPYLLRDASGGSPTPGEREGVGIRIRIRGGVRGTLLVWLDLGSARGVVGQMLGHESVASRTGDIATSALTEFGNISACAFGDALAALVHAEVMPEPPDMVYGGFSEVLATVAAPRGGSTSVIAQMTVDTLHVEGWVALVLDPSAAEDTLVGMGLTGKE